MKRLAPLAIFLLLASAMVGVAQSTSALKNKQTALSRALSKVKEKRAAVQSELRRKERETNAMEREIHEVDAQMSRLANRIDQTEAELKKGKEDQARLGAELRAQTVKFDEVREQVRARLRSIYAQGEATSLSLLAGTQSLGDLATRKALVERIADRDRELFAQIKILRDEILEKKKEQDILVAKIAELSADQKKDLEELEAARAKKKQMYNVLKAQEELLESQYNQMQRESRVLEQQIFEIQSRTSGVAIFKGKFIMPAKGRRSSNFGMRTHPISGRRKMHNGIDIAAPSGTPIVAAGSGKVITASYLRGYGNTVVIDHGGKISTLYGHCSRLFVRVGQSVKQGQKIAAVGSTGYSTGPHLHFEVRVSGKPVNPLSRL